MINQTFISSKKFRSKYENNFWPLYSENLKTGTFFRIGGEGYTEAEKTITSIRIFLVRSFTLSTV